VLVGSGESQFPDPHRDYTGASIRGRSPFPTSSSIIPDGGISPVRLEAKTFLHGACPSRAQFNDGAHALRCPCGLLHASSGWMVADSPDTVFRLVLPLQTVFARGSFTPEALPSFIATTSPCADPGASHLLFVLRTYRRRPCRLHHQRLVIGTVPLWSVFLSWSAAPLVPAVRRVHLTSSSPSTSAFASLRWLGSSARVPTKRLPVGLPFRYGRHSFMLRPSSLFALLTVRHHQLAPEDVLHPSLLSLRCLRDSRVCYPADWSIAGAGLSPARKTAAVGCTVVKRQ